MKKTIILFLLLVHYFAYSQQHSCGSVIDPASITPQLQQYLEQLNYAPSSNFSLATKQTSDKIIMIPVVVHVVYQRGNAQQNVSDAIIREQIDILNNDFRRMNADRTNTPAVFESLAADVQVQFYLATKDPQGNPTTGITRKESGHASNVLGSNNRFITEYNTVAFDSQGGTQSWDNTQYLNIYVADFYSIASNSKGGINADGIAGVGHFPHQTFTLFAQPANATRSNVVSIVQMDYLFFGANQSYMNPRLNLGRILTHEVGHWLSLLHTWGDEDACALDDLVDDTPKQAAAVEGCATFPYRDACSEVVMTMNYMNYSDNNCMNLFTNGQKTRMRNVLDPATPAGIRRNIAYQEVYLESETDDNSPLEIGRKTFLVKGAGNSAVVAWSVSAGLNIISQDNTSITVQRQNFLAPDGTESIKANLTNAGISANQKINGLRVDFKTKKAIITGGGSGPDVYICNETPDINGKIANISCDGISGWAWYIKNGAFQTVDMVVQIDNKVAFSSRNNSQFFGRYMKYPNTTDNSEINYKTFNIPSSELAPWKDGKLHTITLTDCSGKFKFAAQTFACENNSLESIGTGLTARYYSDKTLTVQNAIKKENINLIGNSDAITIPGMTTRAKNISVKWTGYLEVPYTDNYNFALRSDDGIRLKFSKTTPANYVYKVNDWTDHSVRIHTFSESLESKKKYPIEVEFYQSSGSFEARLYQVFSNNTLQVIPISWFHDNDKYLSLEKLYWNTTNLAGSKIINVNTNETWTVTTNMQGVTVEKNANNTSFTINITANLNLSPRSGKVIVSSQSGIVKEFFIAQFQACSSPVPLLSAQPTQIPNGGSTTITALGCTGQLLWNTGNEGSPLIVNREGSYKATCTLDGCLPSDEVAIYIKAAPCTTAPAAPTLSANPVQIANNQTSTLSSTGCTGTVTWNDGSIGITKAISVAGTYTATCTNTGCPVSTAASVTVNAQPVNPCDLTQPKVIGTSSGLSVEMHQMGVYKVLVTVVNEDGMTKYFPRGKNYWYSVTRNPDAESMFDCINVGETGYWGLTFPSEINFIPAGYANGYQPDGAQYFTRGNPNDPCNLATPKVVGKLSTGQDVELRQFNGVKTLVTVEIINGKKCYFPRGSNFYQDGVPFGLWSLNPGVDPSLMQCTNTSATAWWGLSSPPEMTILPFGYSEGFQPDGARYIYANTEGISGGRIGIKEKLVAAPLKLSVSPNPTQGELKATFTLAQDEKVWLNIYDNQGKNIVLENINGLKGTNTKTFDLKNYPTGVYFLNLQTSSKKETVKVLKK